MAKGREQQEKASRANGRLTRERLLAAAIELMAEGGEGAVTLAGAAERAGVTRGTAYHHFKGRDDLVAEMHASLEKQLLRLSDGSRVFTNPYGLIPKLAAEDESFLRSRLYRILEQGPLADPRTVTLLERFRSPEGRRRLRPGVDPDAVAFIAAAMDMAGLMMISKGETVEQRRRLADRFGQAVYQLFRQGVIDTELDPGFPKPPAPDL
jgi:AcrR family transcriptional regulator